MPDDRPPPRKSKAKPKPDRPQIWAEGSQKPKFDARAFAVASLHLTREGIAPLITRTASGTAELSSRVAAGTWRVPTARLGRAERLVPSHQTFAALIAATARLIDVAGRTAAPESQRRRDRFARTAPSVAATAPAAPAPEAPPAPVVLKEPQDADTLAAIRAALDEAPPAETPSAATTPAGDAPPSALADTVTSAAGTVLGWALTAVALPYGAVRAILAHLNGEDLRQIRDDS